MANEKTEVLPWGQHGVIRRKESGLTAQNHRMQDAGRTMIFDMMFLSKLAYKWHQVLSVSGVGVCLDGLPVTP